MSDSGKGLPPCPVGLGKSNWWWLQCRWRYRWCEGESVEVLELFGGLFSMSSSHLAVKISNSVKLNKNRILTEQIHVRKTGRQVIPLNWTHKTSERWIKTERQFKITVQKSCPNGFFVETSTYLRNKADIGWSAARRKMDRILNLSLSSFFEPLHYQMSVEPSYRLYGTGSP